MTTPNGSIVFDASYGSDTQASGLGPATALYGSGATTDGSAVVTGITTTGVTAGDLLWVQTSSGRQFSIIASVDSGTQVTCDDTFSAGLGQTWAIGGKRATWDNSDSRNLFQDAIGWTIETETDQSLTSQITLSGTTSTDSPIRIKSDTAGTIRTITQTINDEVFHGATSHSYYVFTDLKLQCSGSSTGAAIKWDNRVRCVFENCTIGDQTNTFAFAFRRTASSPSLCFVNCIIEYCTSYGIELSNANMQFASMHQCVIRNNAEGIRGIGDNTFYSNCLIYGNTGDGIGNSSNGASKFVNCVIADNGGYGCNQTVAGLSDSVFQGCIFSNNTLGGLAFADQRYLNHAINCSFYNDTATNVNEIDTVTLTADPFTDSATGDYTINETAGGGSTLRSTGITLGSTETRPFRWLDAAASGSGSSSTVHAKFVRLD